MRPSALRSLGFALSVGLLATCTSGPAESSRQPDGAGEVTGGEIIIGGDLNDGAATAVVSTIEPPAPATSSTNAPTTTLTLPAGDQTTAPARPATTTRPATTDAEVVGDGPVLTAPGSDDTAGAPGVGGGLTPAFFAIEAIPTIDCTEANPGTARLRWEVIGSEAVDIAIGSTTKIYRLAQPPAGTLDVPLDCTSGSQYFVIAGNAEGSTTRSVSVAADAAA